MKQISEEARYRAECCWDHLPVHWQTEPVFVNHVAQTIQDAITALQTEVDYYKDKVCVQCVGEGGPQNGSV
jgi:hypothetical protein